MKHLAQKLLAAAALFCATALAAQTPAFSPQNWQRDIRFVQTELPARHPDLFHHLPKKQWDGALEALAARTASLSDLEIALRFQEIVAQVGEQHTALNLTPVLQRESLTPVGYGWFNDGIYVSAAAQRFDKIFGTKVLKINDLPAESVMEKLGRYVSKDNDFGYRNAALQLLRFPNALRIAGLGSSDTIRLAVQNIATGEQFEEKIYPIDLNDRRAAALIQPQRRDPDPRFRPVRSVWSREWVADDLMLFQYNSCRSREMSLAVGDTARAAQLPAFQPVMDSIIAELEARPAARLLIDLRYNGGGGSRDGIQLAERIADSKAINRKGRVFVATNFFTMSSATQVAIAFHRKTNATLLGEPTGDRPNHWGEVRAIELPATGLKLNHSTKFMRALPKKDPDALAPDVALPLTFAQFLAGKDPVLAYLKKL